MPRATIARIAREYATTKPGVLYQGYGMQRRAYGEQVVRAGCVLAAITGNVGIPGGWAGGLALQAPDGGPLGTVFPAGPNPVKASIPTFVWTEAVARPDALGPAQGLRGAERLETGVRLIYAVASNALVNQHANINRTAKILSDDRLVEFLVVQDNFLTPTARFADIVLPACTQFETWGVEDGWKYGDEVLLMPKLVNPPGEARSDYTICSEIAKRLGLLETYTEGRDERGWVEWSLDQLRQARYPALPALPAFEGGNAGVHAVPVTRPAVALVDFRQDPVEHPLDTPSGKIEIFSAALHALGKPTEIPPVPKYIQEWESPFGPEARSTRSRPSATTRSQESIRRWPAWICWRKRSRSGCSSTRLTPPPGTSRTATKVRVFNDRGEMRIRCRVTRRIMPGVVAIPQGAWWKPDEKGVDRGGSINVLTSERWTPLAFGNAQHTIMVEVRKP